MEKKELPNGDEKAKEKEKEKEEGDEESVWLLSTEAALLAHS